MELSLGKNKIKYRYCRCRMYNMRILNKNISKEQRLISYTYRTVENERYLSENELVDRIQSYHELATINDRRLIRKYVYMFRQKFPKWNIYNKEVIMSKE